MKIPRPSHRARYPKLAVCFAVAVTMAKLAWAEPPLTPFKDKLYLPSTLKPISDDGHTRVYRVEMTNGKRRLHSELPTDTPFWGYNGEYPGPTIDVPRDREVMVEFVNRLDAPTNPADPRTQWPFSIPPDATAGGVPHPVFVPREPWTVVHLHGSPTRAEYDGWADNAFFRGGSATYRYPQQERAALYWYHDHANMVTRLNVYAGLVGLYVVRDASTDAGHPSGEHELPLVLQEADLETTPDAMAYTGRFRYQPLNLNSRFEPATGWFLVNGTIQPYYNVNRGKYRLRILNGANSRIFNLTFVNGGGSPSTKGWSVIGVDGGPLKVPVDNPTTATPTAANPNLKREMVVLAPAERLDVVVDFSLYPDNSSVHLASLKANGTVFREFMEFRVAGEPPAAPATTAAVAPVSRSPRLANPYTVNDGQPMAMVAGSPPAVVTRTIGLYMKGGMQTINGRIFHDTAEEIPELDTEEIWEFLNITGDTHPMHLHLVNFEVIDRQKVTVDPAVLATFHESFHAWLADTSPGKPRLPPGVEFAQGSSPLPADAYEKEPKDTVRVPPGSLTRIKVRFRLHTGLYMYHCHILEHEDMEMMRPLLVVPQGTPKMLHAPASGHGGEVDPTADHN